MGKSYNLLFRFNWIIYLLIIGALSSCETFDPVEEAPSFIRVDDFTFSTTSTQGDASHRIEDVWVSIGTEFIGVFPIPSTIPLIAKGNKTISIAPGIRLNGISSARLAYPYYVAHEVSVNLIPDSVIPIVPEFGYSNSADFALIEDFEEIGIKLVATANSYAEIERTDNPLIAFHGQSAKLSLQEEELKFECKSNVYYNLPGLGNPVILEFNYKSNHSLVVGTFIILPDPTPANPNQLKALQQPVITLNPTDEWKRIYVSLIEQVSGNPTNLGIEPFFGFVRGNGVEGELTVYLDNIKLVYSR
ncbi:MAG: hypothetical protein ACI85F_000949 [Bacteroidia bacterium]|jgi:hypothetical protein